jgi:hypothetical protein
VSVLLTSSAAAHINSFIAANSPDAPLVLVWQGQVLYQYPASAFAGGGQVMVASGLSQVGANQLASALQ